MPPMAGWEEKAGISWHELVAASLLDWEGGSLELTRLRRRMKAERAKC